MNNSATHQPGLFGITHSNRDFSQKQSWGKNQFNNSFPVALASYMGYKDIKPIYLSLNANFVVNHTPISVKEIFGLKPLSPNLYFAFERDFTPYQDMVIGTLPRTDLVTMDLEKDNHCLRGLEIKLTALPDNTTCELSDQEYSCEIVTRPDTIVYLALSIAKIYKNSRTELTNYLKPTCEKIQDWTEIGNVLPYLLPLADAIDQVLKFHLDQQSPLVIQPVWKTLGKSAKLSNNCLDIFVWSDFAFTRLFIDAVRDSIHQEKISRQKRSLLWLSKMLYDFALSGRFNYRLIIDSMSFNTKNDKAFALSGNKTHRYLNSPELTLPRITKHEIKDIILGGGEQLLSPERRFDAIIVNSPEIFE